MSLADPPAPTADWSNAFWGLHDEGYEVVLARMRSSAKTVDALQSFWHERIAIEEDYARRLSKLGRSQGALLGKDEEGQLKEALETLGRETDGLGESHRHLASEMKTTIEAPNADFAARLTAFRKNNQMALEKVYKLKLSQEGYVNKARDKLSQQMLLSNSYTAQSSLSQGRELDRVASKLDRAQGNVAAAERDLRTFLGALGETWGRWVDGWKTFCDEAQDLEEERIDFLKDVCWAYANAVSSVCVVDDEACERMRVSLESIDSFAEATAFVRAHATSGKIPDAPRFVNYAAGEREPDEVAFRQARFVRRTERPAPAPSAATLGPGQPNEGDLAARQAGEGVQEVQRAMEDMGLGQSQPPVQAAVSVPAPPAPVIPQQQQPQQYQQQPSLPDSAAPVAASTQPSYQQPPQQQPLPPKLPQSIMSPPPHPSQIPPPPSSWTQPPATAPAAPTAPAVSTQPIEDPIAKALADLQAKRMSRQGSFRSTASRASRRSQVPASPRESVLSPAMQGSSAFGGPSPSLLPPMGGSTSSALANSQADFDARSNGGLAGTASSRNDPRRRSVDYSQAGESIVGHHPASRPSSPSPSAAGRAPSPALMQAPVLPPSALPVEQVLGNYNQSFPGEARDNRARRNSAASDAASAYRQSVVVPSSASQAGHGDRSPSREGFAGVGTSIARAASPSPSFGGQQGVFPNRAPSPSPSFGYQQQQQQQQQAYPGRAPSPNPQQHSGFQHSLQQPPVRGASPAPSQMSRRSVGIALGSNGAVDRDEMADSYRSSSVPPAPVPAPVSAPPQVSAQPPQPVMSPHLQQQQQYSQQTQHAMYAGYAPSAVPMPGQQQQQATYSTYPAAAYGYAPPPPPQGYPAYGQPQQYAGYAPPPTAVGSMAAPPPPVQAQAGGSSQQGHAGRSGSVVSHHNVQGYQQPQQPIQQPAQQQQMQAPPPQQAPQQQGPPTPHSPGAYDQHTDAGQPVIFYVKALYDYTATIPEEFDFQTGDIIAVTATPDDGWWSGELLDETRRRPGQNTFPSNFVTMF